MTLSMVMTFQIPHQSKVYEIINKLDFIKIKNFCSVKETIMRTDDKPQTGRKYLQKAHLIKDCYLKYAKKPLKLKNKKTAQFKKWVK